MLGVEQWAEIRRMSARRAPLAARDPPPHWHPPRHDPPRARLARAAELRPAAEAAVEARPVPWRRSSELLDDEPTLSGVRIREEIDELGYVRRQDDPRRPVARAAAALPAAAAQLPAHQLPPRRAGPVRPLRAALGDPGRLGPDAPRLRRHLRAALLARLRRRAGLLEGVRRHRLRDEPLPRAARRAAGEARLGPRGRDRAQRAARPRPSSPSAASSRSAGSSSTPATARPRARSSAATASCTATSRPAAASPTRSTSSTSSTAGASGSTRACTAPRARSSPSASPQERERMRPLPAALPDTDRRFVIRVPPSPTCASTATTTRSTRAWSAAASRSAPASPRSPRSALDTRRARRPPRARLRRRARLHRPRPPASARRAARRAQATAPRARGRAPPAGPLRPADPGMTKTSELAHLFRALKAPAAARALPKLAERAREEDWGYERFAEALLSTEVASRESHGGESRIKAARFPARKTLEEFDFTFQRSVRKPGGRAPRPARLPHARENVVLLGPPGTGKTPSRDRGLDPRLPRRPARRVRDRHRVGRAPRRGQAPGHLEAELSRLVASSRCSSSTRSATSRSTPRPPT